MARVIPSGTTDYTTQIAMREAAANDALTRLFYTLIMRREEAARQEALRRELQENQQQFTLQRDQNLEQQRLREYDLLKRDRDAQTNRPSKLISPGTGQPSVAPAAPAPTQGPRDPTQFNTPGGSVGPNPKQFSQILNNIYAQADDNDVSDGGTVELSAQRQQQRRGSMLPRPRATQQTPRQSRLPKSEQSVFAGPVPPDVAAGWDASERKYGLARGTLQALMGLYHEGGANDGTEGDDGTDRFGWFKFSKELRTQYGIDDNTARDPIKMGEFAARNLKRNVDATNKLIDRYNARNPGATPIQKLNFTDSRSVPHLALLSQLGVHDGPAAVLQMLVYPDASVADALSVGPDGKKRDGGRVLINIGHSANSTGKEVLQDTAEDINPYFEETVRSQDQGRPVGPRSSVDSATDARAEATGDEPPRPPADVGGGDQIANYLISRGARPDRVARINPEMRGRMAWAMQQAEAATNSRISINNTFRTAEEQAQIRADMRGVRVHYNGVTYYPTPGKRSSGKVAGPGRSMHQRGTAFDFNEGPARTWLRHTKAGRDVLREAGLYALPGDEPHIQLAGGKLPPMPVMQTGYMQEQPAVPLPPQRQAAPQPAPPAPAPAVVKPAVASMDVPTFQAPAYPSLATMPNAIAGMTGGPEKIQVADQPAEGGPAPQTDAATTAAGNKPTPQTAPAAPASTPTAQAGPADSLMPQDVQPPPAASDVGNPLYTEGMPTGGSMQPIPEQVGGMGAKIADVITGPPALPVGSTLDRALGDQQQEPMPGLSVEEFLAGPAPEYQSATDNPFEATGYPGQYTGAIGRGVGSVMQAIARRAQEYNKLQASRNESRQLEQLYDFSRQPDNGITIPDWLKPDIFNPPMQPSIPRNADRYTGAAPVPRWGDERYTPPAADMPQLDTGYLRPDRMYEETDVAMARRLANPPPHTGIPVPDMPQIDTGYLRPDRMYEEQEAALQRRLANPPPDTQGGGFNFSAPYRNPEVARQEQALRDKDLLERQAIAAQTPPQESYSPSSSNAPTRTSTATAEPPPAVANSPEANAPAPAITKEDITGAIYGQTEDNLNWIKRLLNGKGFGRSATTTEAARGSMDTPRKLKVIPITPPPPPDPYAIPKRVMPPIVVKPPSKSSVPSIQLGPQGDIVPPRDKYKTEGGKVDLKDKPKEEDTDE